MAANVLLGISQGLTWSTAVIMKMDLVGPKRRGLAMGFNEAAGYLGVAVTALVTGYLATTYGLRPAPFLLGAAYIALGLGLTVLAVRETHHHAQTEATQHVEAHSDAHAGLTTGQVFTLTSFKDRSLSAASQAGLARRWSKPAEDASQIRRLRGLRTACCPHDYIFVPATVYFGNPQKPDRSGRAPRNLRAPSPCSHREGQDPRPSDRAGVNEQGAARRNIKAVRPAWYLCP